MDFFLGRMTRDHADIDWFAWAVDVPAIIATMRDCGSGDGAGMGAGSSQPCEGPAGYRSFASRRSVTSTIARALSSSNWHSGPAAWNLRAPRAVEWQGRSSYPEFSSFERYEVELAPENRICVVRESVPAPAARLSAKKNAICSLGTWLQMTPARRRVGEELHCFQQHGDRSLGPRPAGHGAAGT